MGISQTGLGIRVMVFNATFNNISVIGWRKPQYPDITTDLTQTLLHNAVSSTHCQETDFELATFVVIIPYDYDHDDPSKTCKIPTRPTNFIAIQREYTNM
jgi:hypothetical protein